MCGVGNWDHGCGWVTGTMDGLGVWDPLWLLSNENEALTEAVIRSSLQASFRLLYLTSG